MLTRRLQLTGYRVIAESSANCQVVFRGGAGASAFEIDFQIPFPMTRASSESPALRWPSFRRPRVTGRREPTLIRQTWVAVPVADCDDLSEAKVKCVGKRLHEFVETRLGQIPPDVEVDATILRSLAPLDSGVRAFLSQSAQVLSATNLLDRETHLRRLLVPNREEVFTLGHYGRVCSFETPEGPNVG